MKKHLSLIVRLLLAAVGVAVIVLNVDWVDKVEVRAGATLNGATVANTAVLRVTAGDVNPVRQAADLTVAVPPQVAPGGAAVVSAAQLQSDQFLLRPSFITTLRHARYGLLLLGLLMVSIVYPIQSYRWLVLMRARGLDVTYAKAFKLTMVGCFFNYSMPGSTGGDVIKAFYAARRSDRRTDSIMSVIFDRIAGLLGLVLLGGIVGLLMLDEPLARRITVSIWIGVLIGLVGCALYFSRTVRRYTGLDWLIARLPGRGLLQKLDNAALAYRHHKGAVFAAVAMSVPVHLALASSTAIAGFALGMDTRFGLLLTVIPVIFLSGTLPITPQGAGVWELLGKAMLLHPPHVTMNQIVAMLMMTRLYQLAYSLLGSAYLLKGDIHLHPQPDESPEARSLQ